MPKMYGWVREVVPESPADRAGLFVTWWIIAFMLPMKS